MNIDLHSTPVQRTIHHPHTRLHGWRQSRGTTGTIVESQVAGGKSHPIDQRTGPIGSMLPTIIEETDDGD